MNEIIVIGTIEKEGLLDIIKRVYDPQGISPALSTMQGGWRQPKVMERNESGRERIRKLTPKECWKLMGFDESDYEKAKSVVSETQLYKQAGNSICVPVLEAIFSQMMP